MGTQLQYTTTTTNMYIQVLSLSLLSLSVSPTPQSKTSHNLPVLFQFSQPTHDVAVFRGAELKQAIAAGLVKGFGNLGGAGGEGRDGRSGEAEPPTTAAPPPPTPPPPPPPTPTRYVAPTTPATVRNVALEKCIQQCVAKYYKC